MGNLFKNPIFLFAYYLLFFILAFGVIALFRSGSFQISFGLCFTMALVLFLLHYFVFAKLPSKKIKP